MNSLGEKIRVARQAKKLTQAELAAAIGVKNTVISNWENNLNKPDIDTIELLCGALDVPARYFFQQQDEKNAPASDGDAELLEYLEELRTRPEMKILFSLTKNATKEQVERSVKIIEAYLDGEKNE